jgi:hypothetical protein
MSITTAPSSLAFEAEGRTSAARRFFGAATQGQSYRNLAYLVLGLPLGTTWFSVLVSGISTGVSLLVVALLGIPVLLGLWYAVRFFANVERRVANALVGQHLAPAPIATTHGGNVWVRLRAMSADRDRWRELGYLMLRFPVGVATFTAATTALATPFIVAYAPIAARREEEPFGDWALSARMDDMASSPWAWFLIPLGLVLLFGSLHLMNALAKACGRLASKCLGDR